MNKLTQHYELAKSKYNEDRIVGIFLQGSQNYGLDYEGSDVDSKLIIAPTLDNIVFNNTPTSTTVYLPNDEHIDVKDIRNYCTNFEKQNINFVEILFTPYKIMNPLYEELFNPLIVNREKIARLDQKRAVKAMVGMALEKQHALEHPYPSKVEVLYRYGYDPKQLHHIVRLKYFLENYVSGEEYESCLYPIRSQEAFLRKIKLGEYSLEEARKLADECILEMKEIENKFLVNDISIDKDALDVINTVKYNIVKESLKMDLDK